MSDLGKTILIVFAFFLFIFWVKNADGHEIVVAGKTLDYTPWVMPQSPTKQSCCSMEDCRTTKVRWSENGWQVPLRDINGIPYWKTVDKADYVYYSTPTLQAHLCEYDGTIYCFKPPRSGI